ncbi:hypothetical protein MLD38_027000 [Melastoma candidum]|uniref:Uncharacterized protein n=1 Tax=Melastoma candidum TaxID=119954 RepID=A0ACB9P386_9MYRT|nr:hypothetical protein MLD38_027000 [Melastoma candidum]
MLISILLGNCLPAAITFLNSFQLVRKKIFLLDSAMESSPFSFPTQIPMFTVPAVILALFFIYFRYSTGSFLRISQSRSRAAPEPPGSWPVLGHLPLLGGTDKLLHRVLGSLSDRLGPVFFLRLGSNRALVINSWEAVKECFTSHDGVFPTRPRYLAVRIMGYDHAMFGFAPYGPYWRGMRKLAVLELLSNHRLDQLAHIRDTETMTFLGDLYEEWSRAGGRGPVKVEMKGRFGDMTMNMTVRTVAGKRYSGDARDEEESRRGQKAMGDFFYWVGQYMFSDSIPSLWWVDVIKGNVREMKKTAVELDWVLGNWVEEHRRRRREAGKISDGEQDFIHFLLDATENDGNFSIQEADKIIKATCLSIILGTNDTTMLTLTWALSLLINNPDKLKEAQKELEEQVGLHRQVSETDIKNLPYLQAVLKETLRLYPAVPVSVPRLAMHDCAVSGYEVRAGTQLLVNLWKIMRDPKVWPEPSEFVPERFLTSHADVDVRGHSFHYIPFGSGRRMCPGVSFGLKVLHLTLARVLHGFKFGRADVSGVDMSEGPGLTLHKTTPLEVTVSPRLPRTCYGENGNPLDTWAEPVM